MNKTIVRQNARNINAIGVGLKIYNAMYSVTCISVYSDRISDNGCKSVRRS